MPLSCEAGCIFLMNQNKMKVSLSHNIMSDKQIIEIRAWGDYLRIMFVRKDFQENRRFNKFVLRQGVKKFYVDFLFCVFGYVGGGLLGGGQCVCRRVEHLFVGSLLSFQGVWRMFAFWRVCSYDITMAGKKNSQKCSNENGIKEF